jgi:hypothetical protein
MSWEQQQNAIKTRITLRKVLKEHGILAKVMGGASDSYQRDTTQIAVVSPSDPDLYPEVETTVKALAVAALAQLHPDYQRFMVRPAANAPKQGRVWK